MTELEYGITVANKYDLLFGDEDPTEILSRSQVDAKKKKAVGEKDKAPGNVLKEKAARSGKVAAPTETDTKTKEKERKIEGKTPREDQKSAQGKKPAGEEDWKSGSRTTGVADSGKTRNVPAGGAPRTDRPQRPATSKPTDAGAVIGKENADALRRPQKSANPAGGEEQRSAAPRRFAGPRPGDGSAPPRRSGPAAMEQDFGATTGPMTGDQEVPMDVPRHQFGDNQRTGFGGGRGYRGGSSFRGRASPRHQFGAPRVENAEGQAAHARGREFERRSGSNKTGVKPVEKREGGGSYNWGSYRDEAEIGTEAVAAAAVPPEAGTTEEGAAPAEGQPAPEGQEATEATEESKEPQVHEKTLKEWLEEEERNRVRPKFTPRAANEGEPEQKVFQRMRRVQREKANADGMVEVVEYVEVDVDEDSHVPAGNGKGGRGGPFQLVFAPASRPPRGAGRGGPETRGGRGGSGRGGFVGGRGGRGGGNAGGRQTAPPAQDELNFPPLG